MYPKKKSHKKNDKVYYQKKLQQSTIEIVCEKTVYSTNIGFKMQITYDKVADALYIEFQNGIFAKNKKIDDFTVLDLDKNGNILGIELLDVSKRIPVESLSEVNVKNLLAVTGVF